MLNERIRVLWKHKERYDGTVSIYDPSDNTHRIDYDDGEKKWYTLDEKTFWLERDDFMIEYAPRAKKLEDHASAAVAGSSTTASTTYVVGTALGGGDGSSLVDKLRELQTARDEELLTESEFQAARQNAIASLTNGSSDVAPFVSQQPTTGPAKKNMRVVYPS